MFVGYYQPTVHDELIEELLRPLVDAMPLDRFGNRAYVERNSAWPGVRIRCLTHYPREVVQPLLTTADQIVAFAAVVSSTA